MSLTRSAKLGALSAATVIAVIALLAAIPAMAATNTATTSSTTTTTSTHTYTPALTVGETITFTSTSGHYKTLGTSDPSGTASGTMVFTVTGAFKGGYTLSLNSGTIAIGSNSYSIASGSAQTGPYAAHMVGQGTFTSSTPGAFIFSAGAHAKLDGTSHIKVSLDVEVGGAEYAVSLTVTGAASTPS